MTLKLNNIGKSFDKVEVLRNISLEIEEGDFLVLLGGSGCGKSTLLNCIAGLEEVSSGTIEIKGRNVTMVDPADRNVAMVFQSYALYPTMSVSRNISFGLECKGVSKVERSKAVNRISKLLQIEELLDRKPSQLSGGQRQRVAIGRALVRDPDIFLLDEPMSNLDANLRNQMRSELRELHGKLNRTFILVTHDQIEAMSMATKVAVLDQGYVQQFGTPYEIYYRPQNKFVAEFIGLNKMNFLEGEIRLTSEVPFFCKGSHKVPLTGYEFTENYPSDNWPVIMGIRPENIYRSKDRLEGDVFLEVKLPVSRSELTGGDAQVWFDFEGQEIASRFRSSRTPDIGTLTTLFLDVRHASLFDAKTGERL